ncbi:MAG: ABC transporter permease [Candidatus Bathyarchaeota archaeon]|jgi:ABC-2 type transport system permease protein|nr:ABC transporter permease [Candidatus Bathyarchaeota archaeon A05DMB-5]MDH7557947.1 ABC transporter permease [Candidatus Bathyarchaeota archaeon]
MMKAILYLLEHDFRNFFRYKWWLVGLISMNLADLFIMAIVYNYMISGAVASEIKSYFNFFAPGLAVTGLFASAFMIGREINMERRREVHHYMLSLPMTRLELAIGRVLSGGLRGMLYMSPLLLTCFIFLGFPNVWQFFLILAVLFLLAVGISGLSIAIAVSTSSLEKFITARGLVYYTLFFCSSVFYPLSLIQQLGQDGKFPMVLVTLAEINPLSNASDMIRNFLLGYPPFAFTSIINVLAFSAIFTLGAAFAYMKIIERT